MAAPASLQGAHTVSTAAFPSVTIPIPTAHDLCATHAAVSSVSENVLATGAASHSWHTVSAVVVPALLSPFPFAHVEWAAHGAKPDADHVPLPHAPLLPHTRLLVGVHVAVSV